MAKSITFSSLCVCVLSHFVDEYVLAGKRTLKLTNNARILLNYKRLRKLLEPMQRMRTMNFLHFVKYGAESEFCGGYHTNKLNAFNSH